MSVYHLYVSQSSRGSACPFPYFSKVASRRFKIAVMAAAREQTTSASAVGTSVIELLAAQDDHVRRAEVLFRHDALKREMDRLRSERKEQAKRQKAMTAAIKSVKRKKQRIVNQACKLSTDDIVQILCLKNDQVEKKRNRQSSSSSTVESVNVVAEEAAQDVSNGDATENGIPE